MCNVSQWAQRAGRQLHNYHRNGLHITILTPDTDQVHWPHHAVIQDIMANKHKVKRFRKEMDIYKISILLELYLWLWFLVNAVQSRGSSLQNRPLVRLPTPPPTYWCIQLWLWITAASVFTISYLHLQLLNTSQWSQVSWKPFVASTLLIFIYKCFTLQQPAARRDDKLLGYFICTDINKYLRNHFRILFYSLPVRLLELETKVREALLGPSPCWNCIIVY